MVTPLATQGLQQAQPYHLVPFPSQMMAEPAQLCRRGRNQGARVLGSICLSPSLP